MSYDSGILGKRQKRVGENERRGGVKTPGWGAFGGVGEGELGREGQGKG